MTRIGRVLNGVIVEVSPISPALAGFALADLFHPSLEMIDLSAFPSAAQGWSWDGTTPHPPAANPSS